MRAVEHRKDLGSLRRETTRAAGGNRPPLGLVLLTIATIVVGVFVFVSPLGMSLWHDEAGSAINYIDGGPYAIFFRPYIANNHPLFNLVAWLTTSLLGRAEVVYRLGSVLPAVKPSDGHRCGRGGDGRP